jgi:hypothetical protein
MLVLPMKKIKVEGKVQKLRRLFAMARDSRHLDGDLDEARPRLEDLLLTGGLEIPADRLPERGQGCV